jgi:hypothetical protein
VGWSTVAASLAVMGWLGGEIAHLPFDHAGVAAVPSFGIDFAGYLVEENLVVIVMSGQGEKNPVSRSWTG